MATSAPGLGQGRGDGPANSPRAAGDQGLLALQYAVRSRLAPGLLFHLLHHRHGAVSKIRKVGEKRVAHPSESDVMHPVNERPEEYAV